MGGASPGKCGLKVKGEMWGVVHMATEDPFITALRHLQKIHEAKVQGLCYSLAYPCMK